jgi:hypothetical protein
MNDELDLDLRDAIRAEAYRAPLLLTATTVRARLEAEDRVRARRPWLAAVAAVAALAITASAISFAPILTRPGGQATSTAGTTCDESTATKHGTWWVEVGGPGAYFNVEPGTRMATEPGSSWLVITRFHPDPGSPSTVAMWAERAGSGERIDGSFNSPMDPSAIYRFDEPAPSLPGGWYLFEQEIPSTGCWQLTAAIDGRVVGSATINVPFGHPPSPTGPFDSFVPATPASDFTAPGPCSQTTEFSYVGISTLTQLGFGRSSDPDYSRPGRIWITAYPVPRALGAGQPGDVLPSPSLAPSRMVCVTWLDDDPTGLISMSIPEDWAPETLPPP